LVAALSAAPSLAAQEVRQLLPEPVLDLAAVDETGAVRFELAVGAIRRSDGSLLVADGASQAIRHFSAAGEPLGRVGRRGNGPGEFIGMISISSCGGDSAVVWDWQRRQFTVLRPDRSLGAQRHVDWPGRSINGVACGSGGSVIVLAVPPTQVAEWRDGRSLAWLGVADTGGRVHRELAEVPYHTVRASQQLGSIVLKHAAVTTFAVGRDEVYVGSAAGPVVMSIPLMAGNSRQLVLPPLPRRDAADADLVAAWDQLNPRPGPGIRERTLAELRKVPMPPRHLPPYSQVLADREGGLVVVTSMPWDSFTSIEFLSVAGASLGKSRVPYRLKLTDVGREYVVGLHEDDAGEQHVLVFRTLRR
jgi:hypothetical protein